LAAEHEARNKKRKAEGLPPLEDPASIASAPLDEETSKRRKLLQETLELDKDDDDDDDDDEGKEKKSEMDINSDEEESDEDEEDDTAQLLRELEKIKKERAEEKARLEKEQSASATASRDAEIASANPLLNLAAALGQSSGVNTTVPGTFQVKKRWDDDLIFKNQAMDQRPHGQGSFVNDLLRTEFHKKFMAKFIK